MKISVEKMYGKSKIKREKSKMKNMRKRERITEKGEKRDKMESKQIRLKKYKFVKMEKEAKD